MIDIGPPLTNLYITTTPRSECTTGFKRGCLKFYLINRNVTVIYKIYKKDRWWYQYRPHLKCSSPRRDICSHSLVCNEISFSIVFSFFCMTTEIQQKYFITLYSTYTPSNASISNTVFVVLHNPQNHRIQIRLRQS